MIRAIARHYGLSTVVLTVATSICCAAAIVMAFFGLQMLSW